MRSDVESCGHLGHSWGVAFDSIGIGSLATGPSVLDLGPEHPSRAGLVRIDVEVSEGLVQRADVQSGFLHRGAEKLFEVRDYRQLLMLADRHDWQSAFTGELGAALTAESMLGLQAPPRAVWLRTLLAELARIGSHLAFLTFLPYRLGEADVAGAIRSSRESFRDLTLSLTGNRVHPMVMRLGGLATDADDAWLASVRAWLTGVDGVADLLWTLTDRPAWTEAAGAGPISRERIESFGLSGPIARASGLDRDLRRTPGYLNYAELSLPQRDTSRSGACHAGDRFAILIEELSISSALARDCLDALNDTPGPVSTQLAKIIKLPEATGHLSIEAPWGVAGWHIVSRGERTPWRVKLRTPTWANMAALGTVLVGTPVEHVDVVVASLGYTIGDLDK